MTHEKYSSRIRELYTAKCSSNRSYSQQEYYFVDLSAIFILCKGVALELAVKLWRDRRYIYIYIGGHLADSYVQSNEQYFNYTFIQMHLLSTIKVFANSMWLKGFQLRRLPHSES